jgi:hypothetical protein
MVTPRKSRKGTPSVKKERVTAMDQSAARPSYDAVARRAYELYLQRGCSHGQDWDDWLSAERQLLSAEG